MKKTRVEAFSDGVIAILITIMVLELRPAHGTDLEALRPLLPTFLAYLLSFVYLGIYWNNHHHMFQAVDHVSGSSLWANIHLLFWLSLVPFTTAWVGDNHVAPLPTALYGVVLLLSAIAYTILQTTLIRVRDSNDTLAEAVGRDKKGKASLLGYLIAIPLAFVNPWFAVGIYVLVALIWLVPDRRIETRLKNQSAPNASDVPE